VDQSGGSDACWPWTKSVFKATGYGQAWEPLVAKSPTSAHRVAWWYTYGDPGKKKVLHRCPGGPNRLCCNPAHLAVGSDKDNADDRAKDGNTFRGEQVTIAKLTEAKVKEARKLYAEGVGVMELAKRYDVAHGTIRPALLGKTWAHVH
jgi:hypothetical protein